MKILYKLMSPLIIIVFIVGGIFLLANTGNLNRPLKHIVQYVLSLQSLQTELTNFQFKDQAINVTKFGIALDSGHIIFNNVQIHITYHDRNIYFDLKPSTIQIIDNQGQSILEGTYSGKLGYSIINKNKEVSIKLSNISLNNDKVNLNQGNVGELIYSYQQSHHDLNLDFKFFINDETYLTANNSNNPDQIDINGKNIPLLLSSVIINIFSNNGLAKFLDTSIKAGYLTNLSGTLDIKDTLLTVDSLNGIAQIKQMKLLYNNDLPAIENMDVDIECNGRQTTFSIKKAHTSNLLISNGKVVMDWQGIDDTILKITGKGTGKASELSGFISDQIHNKLREGNIDLYKIKGNVEANIEIIIPLKPGTDNKHNITAFIPNASLAIFDDKIQMSDATIQGLFNGPQVILNSKAKINGFASNIDFVYNINNHEAFHHKLDISTNIAVAKHQKSTSFINILEGKSVLHFNYTNKNSQGFISANADLTNLDLTCHKLGLHKKIKEQSIFKLQGTLDDFNSGEVNFLLTSKKNLKIDGSGKLQNSSVLINIKEFKNKLTNLSAQLNITKPSMNIAIKGQMLDLSNVNMMQFLEKENDQGAIKISTNIKKIKLHNNVLLNDLQLMLECDKSRCYKGFIDSQIGTASLELLLTAEKNTEKWLVKCDNAGDLMRGLGMYNSMLHGSLVLNIETSRTKVPLGEIIPIYHGNFSFEKFKLYNAPAILRVVSFVSIPGFLSMISGNKDISFSGMQGDFSFQHDILHIFSSQATGPYFDFTLKGDINVNKRIMDIKGHVTPALYGISSIIGAIPIIGEIFVGNSKHRGLVSKAYKLQEVY